MRTPALLGSAILGSLTLLAGGVSAGTASLLTAPQGAVRTEATSPTASTPTHLDEPRPGVHARLSTEQLIAASGVRRRPARFAPRRQPAHATRSTSSTAADQVTPVQVLSVPGGTAVLGGLGTHVSPSCDTTTDTARVQVVYAHEQSTPSRHAELLATLRSYVADVDDTFALSSPQSGRRARWVIDANCQPEIPDVVVPDGAFTGNTGASALDPMIAALAAVGMNRADRKYLVFADAPTQFCGIGESYQDDRPTSNNANNGGVAMYARVDPTCWPTYADYHSSLAHELMHMLGAVQPSAPHATLQGHCTDEADALCYDDGSNRPVVSTCTSSGSEAKLDCNHDDYFDDSPTSSGYLATAWNTARSSFLDVVPALGATTTTTTTTTAPAPSPVTVALSAPASLYVGVAGRVSVNVTSGSNPVSTGVKLQTYTAATGWRVVASATSSLSGVAILSLRNNTATRLPVRAIVPATSTVAASRSAAVLVSFVRRPTSTRGSLRTGRPDVLTATVRTNLATPVVSQYVTLQLKYAGTTTWRTVTRKLTNSSGQAVVSVQPKRRTYYRWIYPGSWKFAPSTSATATVTY